jgi:RimJ/RimL family protein N-acetyltransferase
LLDFLQPLLAREGAARSKSVGDAAPQLPAWRAACRFAGILRKNQKENLQMSVKPAFAPTTAQIILETPNFYMRRLSPSDASERIGAWFEQPEVAEGLNAEPVRKSLAEMQNWIAGFDQHTNRVNGMFDKRNNMLVTLGNSQFNWEISRVMMNIVVGEESYRHAGVILEATVPVRDFYFDDMKMKVITGTALATNRPILAFMESTGFTRMETLKNFKMSKHTGKPVDLHLYALTREAWADWKSRNGDTIEAIRDCSARLPPL